jgi:glycosyltransferase involved in cell wall biosynthesis
VRICIIGKFPPIQGGVSARTYWTAHGLAALGHEVHVVTNAKEARPPFRMHMRAEDWKRCEASSARGSVTVHWTDPVDRTQSYIPMASPFVSKLAAVAAGAHSARAFDVIYSHYMEPYGVAGYLASQITGVAHVVRMAGSDAGRLWHHPQFEALYDHVLRSAEIVVAAGAVARRAIERGVDPHRIAPGGGYALPQDLFTPQGPLLELDRLRTELAENADVDDALWGELAQRRAPGLPYFGIYGKLGENKGSFALLSAMHRLKLAGAQVGLVALAHGRPEVERRFRERARELGLTDRILQIPFLPHWRVPELLRSCLAVCCLEQDFPIGIHTPIIPLEVLLCGACLVGSTEVIRKLPQWDRLPHGYGCVAIEDVDDIEELTDKLAAIVRDPKPAAAVGARGCRFARDLARDVDFPHRLERILQAAAGRRPLPSMIPALAVPGAANADNGRFPLTQIAAAALADMAFADLGGKAGTGAGPAQPKETIDLAKAQRLLAAIQRAIADGKMGLRSLAQAVQVEIAIAVAERECDESMDTAGADPLFRLSLRGWAMAESDLGGLVPIREPHLRVLQFDYDVSEFRHAKSVADFPRTASPRASAIVVFGRSGDARRDPLLIDGSTAGILELSDGTRTVAEIASQFDHLRSDAATEDELKWIENLFLCGLVRLEHGNMEASSRPRREINAG